MTPAADGGSVETIEQLEQLYDKPLERSLIKEVSRITERYREFIEQSPFAVVATVGGEGLDCSPRGDPAGLARVADERTLLLPDRRGNNRLDTLRNLVRDPRISLLFLIPGIGETMRVNGTARILTSEQLLASFAVDGKTPRCVVSVHVERIYFQCQKALVRSRLWDPEAIVPRDAVPTAGAMLSEVTNGEFDGKSYDSGYPEYMKTTIY